MQVEVKGVYCIRLLRYLGQTGNPARARKRLCNFRTYLGTRFGCNNIENYVEVSIMSFAHCSFLPFRTAKRHNCIFWVQANCIRLLPKTGGKSCNAQNAQESMPVVFSLSIVFYTALCLSQSTSSTLFIVLRFSSSNPFPGYASCHG